MSKCGCEKTGCKVTYATLRERHSLIICDEHYAALLRDPEIVRISDEMFVLDARMEACVRSGVEASAMGRAEEITEKRRGLRARIASWLAESCAPPDNGPTAEPTAPSP